MRTTTGRWVAWTLVAVLPLWACDGGEEQGSGGEGPGVSLDVVQGGTDVLAGSDAAGGDPDVAEPDDAAGEQDLGVATPDVAAGDTGGAPDTSTVDPKAMIVYEPTAAELAAYPQCTLEKMTLTVHGNKVATLALGNGGHDGHGLDVDGDPATCAPVDDCDSGIDNQLGALGAIVNGSLVESLDAGVIMLVLEYEGYAAAGPGNPFNLKMYTARIDPDDEDCDWQTEECIYNIRADSYDENCNPLMTFDNAVIASDGAFTAGGPDGKFILSVPLFGLTVQVPVYKARIIGQADVKGGVVLGMEGLIAGAVPKSELLGAVEVIPDEEFTATGFSKDFIVSAIDSIVADDIDTDGDGVGDGASVGIRFGAIPGKLAGFEIPAKP